MNNNNSTLLYKNSKFIKELTPSNFNNNLTPKTKKPTLVKFYAHWCPHCTDPETHEFMEALAETLPKKANIDVAAFSCESSNNHSNFARKARIAGYPTFRYYNKNGKISDYNGPRNVEALLQFMLKNS